MAGMPRITEQTEKVFRVLLTCDLAKGLWGFEIAREAGLPTGTVQPILVRWERAGILESYWEDAADHEDAARPRRRYYRFAPDGVSYVRISLAAAAHARRATSPGAGSIRPLPPIVAGGAT